MRVFLTLCICLWAGAWLWSLIGFAMTEPEGDGFTRGLNRVRGLFMWQFVAASLAIPIWLLGAPQAHSKRLRWAARAPVLLGLVPLVIVVIVVATALLAP